MRLRNVVVTLGAAAALTGVSAGSASAATVSSQESVSQNWAGYVAGNSSSGTQFSSVSGSWVQPTVSCTSGQSYSAYWVGLGGSSGQSDALEQTGTQGDCTANGGTQYYAWYELVPAAPVQLSLAIHPGDHISAKVSVSGSNVTVWLSDQTTGQSTTKNLQMSNPDTSSAEWIAEAPSQCDGSLSSCTPLPLTNFGTAQFTSSSATDTDGHTGPISDPAWAATAVTLSPDAGSMGFDGASFSSTGSSGGATPSALSTDGSAFSVAYSSDGSATQSGGAGGYGAGSGGYSDGSGGYSDGSGGYSDGSGGYGYGGGGYGSGGDGYGDGSDGYGYSGGGYGDGSDGYGYSGGGYGDGYGDGGGYYVIPGATSSGDGSSWVVVG
jgi:Peptidase A4 family